MPEFFISTPEQQADTGDASISVGDPLVKKTKSPYTEAQNRAAGFTYRMTQANDLINKIEDSGFNPVNLKDFTIENFPLVGGTALTRFFLNPKYKQYDTAKVDFSTAQLRRETGAVINDSEIVWINQTYFPIVGDDEGTLNLKRQNRENAINAMKAEAGNAYTQILKQSESNIEAMETLKARAEKNPELKNLLKNMGAYNEQ